MSHYYGVPDHAAQLNIDGGHVRLRVFATGANFSLPRMVNPLTEGNQSAYCRRFPSSWHELSSVYTHPIFFLPPPLQFKLGFT
jgi:hypothetical protein